MDAHSIAANPYGVPARVSALILFLQSRRVVTTEHLAAHFELGAWTNHRNIMSEMIKNVRI